MMPARPTIVHLAVDFNTPQRKPTTRAIEWFVDELTSFDNVVIAFTRSSAFTLKPPSKDIARSSIVYHFPFFGLPYGLGLHGAMRRAAQRTIARLEQDHIRPDLVHAHKLTFEGLAGWYVARHFGVPLFISLRGEVETKVFRMKPTLRGLLRGVSRDAARLYFVSAWFRREFHRSVPPQPSKEALFPNIVRNISPVIVPKPAGAAFVTVLNLDTWRRKGLRWLLDGFALALAQDPSLRLDIIGGGSARSAAQVEAMIAARKLQAQVRLVGPVPNDMVLQRLPTYRGLLLPSLNETFGMVYVEALFAGIPILMTAGTAIDGYLGGLDLAFTVPPKHPEAISAAVLQMSSRNDALRANIAAAAPELFERFDPSALVKRYERDVEAAITSFTRYE